MATVTAHPGGSANFTTTGGDTVATVNLTAGDLVVVFAGTSGLAGGTTAVTDDNSSGTYTQVDVDRTGFSTTGVLTAWVRNSLVPSTASTNITASQGGSSGGGLDVFAVSGMVRTGALAVRGSGGQSTGTAGTAPAPVLTQAALTGNPVLGAICNGSNPATLTPRGTPAYTEATDTGYNTPTTGLETMFINSGETASTITWGGTSATAFASLALELDTSALPVIPDLTLPPLTH